MAKVIFTYNTGIDSKLFKNPRLHGSWDANGHYSNVWTVSNMTEIIGEDGCPAFTGSVELNDAQVGWTFYWGVSFDTATEQNAWAIMTETHDQNSRERTRQFVLNNTAGVSQTETYYLNESRRLGAQKYYRQGENKPGIRFAVWAPNAESVDVVFSFIFDSNDPLRKPATASIRKCNLSGGYIADDGAGIHPDMKVLPMKKDISDIWFTDVMDNYLKDFSKFDHKLYMYRIRKKGDNRDYYRTDLYSRCQVGSGNFVPNSAYHGKTSELDGSVGCSVVVNPDLVTEEFNEPIFPETKWITPAEFWKEEINFPNRPKKINDLIIYELHLGALGFGKSSNEPGNIDDAIAFLPHLKELGVNAVELLPMSEFGGGIGNWGYSTSHYFAIEYSGGGRDQFKFFIRKCHELGISVIADVVYNHYAHSAERAEWMYDTNFHNNNCYYWYEGNPWDYPQDTGGYVDNDSSGWAPGYHEERVRKIFISSAIALATEFHIDGFRVDQTTSIHAYNKLHANGREVDNANLFGQKFLREFTSTLKLINPELFLIAEDHSNTSFVTTPTNEGGLGFDAAWYADFYHHLVGDTDKGTDYAKLLKTAGEGGGTALAIDFFSGALNASKYNKVVYSESHDEAGNGKFTDRNIWVGGSNRFYSEERGRVVAGLNLLSAGTPMFLFGEEVCAEKKFLYGKVLENRENYLKLKETTGKNHYEFYKQAMSLRKKYPAFGSRNMEIIYTHNQNRVLVFKRWDEQNEFLIISSFADSHYNQPHYSIISNKINTDHWQEIFNSNATMFGGDNVGNFGSILPSDSGTLNCIIPKIP